MATPRGLLNRAEVVPSPEKPGIVLPAMPVMTPVGERRKTAWSPKREKYTDPSAANVADAYEKFARPRYVLNPSTRSSCHCSWPAMRLRTVPGPYPSACGVENRYSRRPGRLGTEVMVEVAGSKRRILPDASSATYSLPSDPSARAFGVIGTVFAGAPTKGVPPAYSSMDVSASARAVNRTHARSAAQAPREKRPIINNPPR